MSDQVTTSLARTSAHTARLSAVALALLLGSSQIALAQAAPATALPGPVGRWVGSGVQVDWRGDPMELPRIEVTFGGDGQGDGTINYPSLGCSGVLTRIGASDTVVQYRETLKVGADRCPSGAFVGFRATGDRWVYSWALTSDWLKPEALMSQPLPSQPAAGPDGDGVRSGVLSSDPAPATAFVPRDSAAGVADRIARIEGWMVPPVVVKGEAAEKATLADRMAALHVPGVSIAVIHNGRIDWARSYGVASPDGAPVTPRTLFQAASISKPVTALTAMRVAQDRNLDLDADVDALLKGWTIPKDGDAADRLVTLRSLLNHTAGVSVHGFSGYAPGEPVPTLDEILRGEKPSNSGEFRIDTAPGVQWRYSGGGYVIIRKLLEDVTGAPFAELANRLVLAPAGMADSTFSQPLSAALMKSAASPYGPDGQPLKSGAHTYPELGPDGLWSTPTDLARLVIAVQRSLKGDPNAILKASTMREMMEPGGFANWGLGWGLGGSAEHPYFWHSGSNAGFKSMLFAYGEGEGAVVMTNADMGEKLSSDIVRTIAYEYGWPDFRPAEIAPVAMTAGQLDRLAGRYQIGRYAILTVTRKGDALFAQTPDRPSFRIYPTTAADWFAIDPDGFNPGPNTLFSFRTNPRGEIDGLVMRENGFDIDAAKLDDMQAGRVTTALAARMASKASSDKSEKAMRGYIADMEAGRPDYGSLGPGAAYITRLLLLNFGAQITALGALRELDFVGAGPNGADQFVAKFEHGAAKALILLSDDGKIESVMLMSPTFM